MPRGGYRPGAGAKSSWRYGKTTTIRVPVVLAKQLLEIARKLDDNESVESVSESFAELIKNRDLTTESLQTNSFSSVLPANNHSFFSLSPSANFHDSESEVEKMARQVGIQGLYYIVHLNNIISILENGILSHNLVETNQVNNTPVYNLQIVDNRSRRLVEDNKSLWNYANLYFQPRNAMLYSVIHKNSIHEVAIIGVSKKILSRKNIFITTGNAASIDSQILSIEEGKKNLVKIRNQIDKDWWNPNDGSKREMMAECLVPEKVAPSYIQMVYVASDKARNNLQQILASSNNDRVREIPIAVEPKKFFQPDWRASLANNVSIVRGDMFFSTMQTLTVSVNCVGVMGKGLASTAKYRFPDLYVKYEDFCKNKTLRIGQPCLYKREASVLSELADDTFLAENIDNNSQTWFLLFPTKNHWKNQSNISDIEKGLQWLCANYKNEGIKSLAIPALGCGLGGLDWREVGPLMCKYLITMEIPVAIYLPAEREISDELVSREFLLSQTDIEF